MLVPANIYSAVSTAAVFLSALLIGIVIGSLAARRHIHQTVKQARNDAVKRSRAVLNGQYSEQFAAYFPRFPANPAEVRFIGKPVDFIAFSGSATGDIKEVLFIEIKTGSSSLSKIERSLKKALENKHVRYCEYRLP
ncbi:MAG: Holliday junction resolvase-like protein [Treponema sp.]